jgi:hypothetical protein
MTAECAEAAALRLLFTVAKAAGVDLDQENAGWSKKEILNSYRECVAEVRRGLQGPPPQPRFEDAPARAYGADEAWQNVANRNKFARWGLSENPKRVENSATMRLRSPLFLPGMAPKFQIQNSDVIFCIGSCFARNIERALTDFGLDCASIPSAALQSQGLQSEALTKFSTASMLTELRWALDVETPFEDAFLLSHNDGTFTDPHSRHGVAHVSREEALAARHRGDAGNRAIGCRRTDAWLGRGLV